MPLHSTGERRPAQPPKCTRWGWGLANGGCKHELKNSQTRLSLMWRGFSGEVCAELTAAGDEFSLDRTARRGGSMGGAPIERADVGCSPLSYASSGPIPATFSEIARPYMLDGLISPEVGEVSEELSDRRCGVYTCSAPRGSNSVGRVSAFQAECRRFESGLPLPEMPIETTILVSRKTDLQRTRVPCCPFAALVLNAAGLHHMLGVGFTTLGRDQRRRDAKPVSTRTDQVIKAR